MHAPFPSALRRLYRGTGPYVIVHGSNLDNLVPQAVSREAEYREHGEVLEPAAFTRLRRENSAIRLCFGLFEAMLHIDLPDRVFADATFMRAYFAAADMVCWANVRLLHIATSRVLIRDRRTSIRTTWSRRRATRGTTLSPSS